MKPAFQNFSTNPIDLGGPAQTSTGATSFPAASQKSPAKYTTEIMAALEISNIDSLSNDLNSGVEMWGKFNSLATYIQKEILKLLGSNSIYHLPRNINTIDLAIKALNTFINDAVPSGGVYDDLRNSLTSIRNELVSANSATLVQPTATTSSAALAAAPVAANTPAKKTSAKKTVPTVAVPATTPTILTTTFENWDYMTFIGRQNFARANTTAALRLNVASVILQINKIELELARVCSDLSLQPIILNTKTPSANIETFLDKIVDDCDNFLRTLPNSLDRDNRNNIISTIINIKSAVTETAIIYNIELARINAPAAGTPPVAPPTGKAPATPAVVSTNPTDLERQMKADWRSVERDLHSEQDNYEHKKHLLQTFINNLKSGVYGGITTVPVSTKISETKDLTDKAESVVNEMNFNTDIKSTDTILATVNRLVKKAKDASEAGEISEVEAAVRLLRKDFRTTLNQARKIKVPEDVETKLGSNKYKTVYKEINLGRNPLVYYMLFSDMFRILDNELTDTFFDEQKKRIKDYEKAVEDMDKMANEAIQTIKALDIKIIAAAKIDITKKGWEDFLATYIQYVQEAQETVDAKISAIAKTIGGDGDKIKKYANKKRDEIVVVVSELKKNYDMTKLPSGAPRGLSAGTIWRDIYKKIESVTDASGSISSFGAPKFISVINITVPTLEMAQGQTSPAARPTPPSNPSAAHDLMAEVPGYFPKSPRARVAVAVGVLLALTAIAGWMNASPKDTEGADGKGGVDKKPAVADDGTASAGEMTKKLEQATENMQRAARTLQETAAGNAAYTPRAQSGTEARVNRVRQLTSMSDDKVLQEVARIGGGKLKTLNGVELISNPKGDSEKGVSMLLIGHEFPKAAAGVARGNGVTRLAIINYLTSEGNTTSKKVSEKISIANTAADLAEWLIGGDHRGERFVIYQPIDTGTGKIISQLILFRDDFTNDIKSTLAKAFRDNFIIDAKGGGVLADKGIATVLSDNNIFNRLDSEGMGGKFNLMLDSIASGRLDESITNKIKLFKSVK